MAELAEDRREEDHGAWTALAERARKARERDLGRLMEKVHRVLPPGQLHLFQRSVEPTLRG